MKLNTTLPRVWNARRRAKTYAEHRGNPVKHGIKSLCDNMITDHFGGWEYAHTFGPRMVLVKVDPKDLVCVPYDCSHGKVRCSEYEVLKEVTPETQMRALYEAGYIGDLAKAPKPQGPVKTCRACGTENAENANFCGACGEPFGSTCDACGNALSGTEKFCPACGADLSK